MITIEEKDSVKTRVLFSLIFFSLKVCRGFFFSILFDVPLLCVYKSYKNYSES